MRIQYITRMNVKAIKRKGKEKKRMTSPLQLKTRNISQSFLSHESSELPKSLITLFVKFSI